MSIASYSSFKAPSLLTKRSFLDREGRDIPLNYTYKSRFQQLPIQIITPQELTTYVSSDKTVHFRYIQLCDPQFMNANASLFNCVRISVVNQRNTYDNTGKQSQIVGYLNYNQQSGFMIGETLQFEVDSRQSVQLTLEKYNLQTFNWDPFVLSPQTITQSSYIYLDCDIQYDYNNL